MSICKASAGLAAVIAMLAISAGIATGEPQHPPAASHHAPDASVSEAAAPLDRADPHVAQLFNVLRAARGQGDKLDMAKLETKLRDIGRAHAVEYEIDQAASEQMILETAHKAWMAAQQHPENLASLETFNKSIGAW